MGKKTEKLRSIAEILDKFCPAEIHFLTADADWKFLFLVILTAQSTDRRVMEISGPLFSRFPDLKSFEDTPQNRDDLEEIVRPVGFYHAKARSIIAAAEMLIGKYGSAVPCEMDELLKIPGVGRKTANCVRAEIFGIPAIITDTHFMRCSVRLGFADKPDPLKIEDFYRKNLAENLWTRFSMTLNYFGRTVCRSARPQCSECPLRQFCCGCMEKRK